ncbi:MAG: type II toxin-antitoxin system RelE/ParE family toxin [Polyangiaceae bacterium]|nr:type II toxin-antitoxin system RelE/ParE family toxin [Polyangiaceae bacterium]
MRVEFHPEADDEYVAAVMYYEDDYPGRGQRFQTAVEAEIACILSAPNSYPLWRRSSKVRYAIVSRFPYTILFSVYGEALTVYAVAHDKRRPGYWRTRL